MADKIDCVWMLGKDSDFDNWEVRYSLRSCLKNFRDMGTPWIIGVIPDWIDRNEVRCIDFPDPYTSCKDANLIGKLLRLTFEEDLSERFIYFSDDQFVLRDCGRDDFKPYHCGDLSKDKFQDATGWRMRLYQTYLYLEKHGKTTWSMDGHVPYPVNKSVARKLLETNFGAGKGYTIFTLYYNWCHFPELGVEPVAINSDRIRGTLHGEDVPRETVLDKMGKNLFCNFNNASLRNFHITSYMESTFSEVSPYEKDGGGEILTDMSKVDSRIEQLRRELTIMEQAKKIGND
jgi:hypothetical protein